jgi:hypothetical protein
MVCLALPCIRQITDWKPPLDKIPNEEDLLYFKNSQPALSKFMDPAFKRINER